ncbi:uncharacterized protein LOC114523975 [Dendronephthya gigantea]|uniref:uncharacterized protein LOC114523975 n=1 Tax=Dendronephthya gigantea TaxID=151771 RepID=UPI00106A5489|nr:uncharacterized protein LOC114523975 [Dendronephthya gigantea]
MKDGVEQLHLLPKFKNGEAVVRNVKVKQNFDYVDEIYNTMIDAISNKKLNKAIEELKGLTPPPMNKMLDMQPRAEAIDKKKRRENMPIVNVPPTNPVPTVVIPNPGDSTARNKPKCKACKQPMKGHKNVKDCPKNQNK